ncbi:hypothetical protein IG631_22464 [Alternaria alternata]|nr:hypothetical protein IG631_22464 [Alternaria alternata]
MQMSGMQCLWQRMIPLAHIPGEGDHEKRKSSNDVASNPRSARYAASYGTVPIRIPSYGAFNQHGMDCRTQPSTAWDSKSAAPRAIKSCSLSEGPQPSGSASIDPV